MEFLMPGAVLQERYHIEKVLHKGASGGVYKAKDARFPGRFWTVREIVLQLQDEELQSLIKKRFTALVKQLSLFDYPALPKIIDYFSCGLRLYVVMEYIDAQSMDDLFQKSTIPFSEKQTILLGLQLVDLLTYIYSKRDHIRISPDLKLTNLLVTARGEVKFVDLGLQHILLEDKVEPSKTVSIGYGAPELYDDNGDMSEQSYIYSIGVVMHQMLTHRNPEDEPFVFPPVAELNPFVSSGTSSLVSKALARSPDDRFDSLSNFGRELKQQLEAVKTGRELPPVVKSSKPKRFLFWSVPSVTNKKSHDFGDGSDIPLGIREERIQWQKAVWWGILIALLSGLSFLGVYVWYLFSRR